jgi:acyl-CoA dehydrogenase
MRATLADLADLRGREIPALRGALGEGILTLEAAGDFLLETGKQEIERAAAGATPYLRLFGTVAGGWLLAKGAAAAARRLAAGDGDPGFLRAKLATARFYAENVMPQAAGLTAQVITGADSTLALDEALL